MTLEPPGAATCPFARSDLEARARDFAGRQPPVESETEYWDLMAAFRDQMPAFRSEQFGGYWVFTRYEACLRVLKDNETFSSRVFQIPLLEIPGTDGGGVLPESADMPEHRIYRSALSRSLAPPQIAAIQPRASELARELMAGFAERGHGDLVTEFCVPLPATLFLLLLGSPIEDARQLLEWKDRLLRDGLGLDPDKRRDVFENVMPVVMEYFDAQVRARRQSSNPPDDLLTTLAQATFEGRPWSEQELHRTYVQYLTAGLDTVTNALSSMLHHLLTHPDDRRRLADDREALGPAIEELLRHVGLASVSRYVTREVEVEGVQLREGDLVHLVLPSACRDAAEFPDPEDVLLDRFPNRHMAFGMGRHRCQGSHLARMELRVALDAFLDLGRELEIAPDSAPAKRFGGVFGFERLAVASNARPGAVQP